MDTDIVTKLANNLIIDETANFPCLSNTIDRLTAPIKAMTLEIIRSIRNIL